MPLLQRPDSDGSSATSRRVPPSLRGASTAVMAKEMSCEPAGMLKLLSARAAQQASAMAATSDFCDLVFIRLEGQWVKEDVDGRRSTRRLGHGQRQFDLEPALRQGARAARA